MKNSKLKIVIVGVMLIDFVVLCTVPLHKNWFESENHKKQKVDANLCRSEIVQNHTQVTADNNVRIHIVDYYYSRHLEEDIKPEESVRSRFRKDSFQEDGTILDTYQYLYVDMEVTNIGEDTRPFAAGDISYIEVNNEGDVLYDSFPQCNFQYLCDDYHTLSHGKLERFPVGSTIRFRLIYVVADEAIARNDIGIYMGAAKPIDIELGKENSCFVMLNLHDRQR